MAPEISVVANFFNMRREAKRTLYSLTSAYQHAIGADQFEVIVVDNGSTEPLDEKEVRSFGDNFHYVYHPTTSKSPAGALNRAVEEASTDLVLCLIDGARILSPGILIYTLRAAGAFENPFVYTLAMHLGLTIQNTSMAEGYNQRVEDELLETIVGRRTATNSSGSRRLRRRVGPASFRTWRRAIALPCENRRSSNLGASTSAFRLPGAAS